MLALGPQPLLGRHWPVAVAAVGLAVLVAAAGTRWAAPEWVDAAILAGLIWAIGLIPVVGSWPVGPGLALILTALLAWRHRRIATWRRWLRVGRLDRTTWFLCGLTAVVSVAGLLVWQHGFAGTLPPDYAHAARSVPAWTAGLGGFVFLVVNGLVEDLVFFGIFLTAVSRALGRGAVPLIAVVFGASHLYGVPNGLVGAAMASSWGLILAFLRDHTGGMLATYLAHVIADATIVLTLLPLALAR